METETLNISLVFKAMSKPMMFFGVDYNYFFIVAMAVMLVFICSGNLISFLMVFPLHLIGWILCKLDPHIFKLLSVRASVGAVKNKAFWGCQSYEAF